LAQTVEKIFVVPFHFLKCFRK